MLKLKSSVNGVTEKVADIGNVHTDTIIYAVRETY